jgi:hypothetical protein
LLVGEVLGESARHAHRAQGHDERNDAKARYQHAVDGPTAGSGGDAGQQRDRRRQPDHDGELAHDHRAQDHDRADREIDAGGDHDQCLGDTDHAESDYHHLCGYRLQVVRGEKRSGARAANTTTTSPSATNGAANERIRRAGDAVFSGALTNRLRSSSLRAGSLR